MLKPLQDRVVVERLKEEEKVNGIYLPDSGKEKPAVGKVLAVGSGKIESGVRIPLDVKPGDTVLFGKYSGAEIEEGGIKLLILREDELYAVRET